MKKGDLTKYKVRLEDELVKLNEDLGNIGIFNNETNQWEAIPSPQEGPESDLVDLADRIEDYEGRSEMVKTLSKRLSDVQNAISKIENGTYGICEISGQEIEEDRLEANPAARTCKAHIND